MESFEHFNLSKQISSAISDLGFDKPTPMQQSAYSPILSGRDIVGIAQTGTGKTLAYILPLLRDLKFSKEIPPVVLVLVPTRELVLQVVDMIESISKYMNIRVLGVFGGTNIHVQKQSVAEGCDILVATPGRLYDIALSGVLRLKNIKKLVIDEVDVLLDAGFRYQLKNILELLPQRRQNIMFSATMTNEVDELIDEYFTAPEKIAISISGTPLDNIQQHAYPVPNFNTKVNLLSFLLSDIEAYNKVLVFVSGKKMADRLYENLMNLFPTETGVIHGNKTQNYRIKSIRQFDEGEHRILIATDLMARGLDFAKISHVINFDTPEFPENYIHRMGRTGRAEQEGKTILFFTEKEREWKNAIESLMQKKIAGRVLPEEVEISKELIPEERPKVAVSGPSHKNSKNEVRGPAFHEKKEKNKKTNQGGSYLRKMKTYKKPKTKGDKIANRRKKK